VFPALVAAKLGIAADRVVYHQGDTDALAAGRGSGGSSGLCVSGSAGALAATINAICDAPAPLGIRHLEMPATPDRVWAAIQAAAK
jgi:carbon-monoxide dehydrogenase large subunit